MLFRPRIFISSTFEENKETRPKIEKIFLESGAEPLLYERTLTPSTLSLTYRQNVLDSDFIILILKEDYGSKTDSGFSGTHEEYKIAKANKVPMHVYLMKEKENQKSEKTNSKENAVNRKKFVDELKNDNVSYYYFSDEDDLLKRIKETTFTIAKEIMINNILKLELSDNDVAQLSLSKDYSKAVEIFKIIDEASRYHSFGEYSFSETSLFRDLIDKIKYDYTLQNKVFIDSKLDKSFKKFHSVGAEICDEIVNNSEMGYCLTKISLGTEIINLFAVKYGNAPANTVKSINNGIQRYFNLYNQFKREVERFKMFYDITY